MIEEKILFVDDDENILNGYKRSLRKDFNIHIAPGGEAGFKMLQDEGPFAVVVSDYRMPDIDGVQFLALAREHYENCVRVMLTGQADMDSAIKAINEGNIFRFLSKPCSNEFMLKTLNECLELYRLKNAEKLLLEETLTGAAKVLVDVLSTSQPLAYSRTTRIQKYTRNLLDSLSYKDRWAIQTASMLSQIGCVSVPNDILQKVLVGQELTTQEQELYDKHPQVAQKLLQDIPRLEPIVNILQLQSQSFSEFPSGQPDSDEEKTIHLGAQILKAANDLDVLIVSGNEHDQAIKRLRLREGLYNPDVLDKLQEIDFSKNQKEELIVNVNQLEPGMIFNQDVKTKDDVLLVTQGNEVNWPTIERLNSFAKRNNLFEPIKVILEK